eukprot:647640-Pelagomonas_calceolata.AAC.1
MHATCRELVSGSTRGGMEGVEGELVASALGWGPVVPLGFDLTESTLVIQNLQRPVTIMSACGSVGLTSKVTLLRSYLMQGQQQ